MEILQIMERYCLPQKHMATQLRECWDEHLRVLSEPVMDLREQHEAASGEIKTKK